MMKWMSFGKSLVHALRGLKTVFQTEQSFRLQVVAAILAFLLAWILRIPTHEWMALMMIITMVLALEMVNSVLERVLDAFKPRLHPIIKDAKDIMASAVLLASFCAVILGVLIFYPSFQLLLRG